MPLNPFRSTYRRLLRFGFRLLYNELAWTYDTVSGVVSLGEWRSWGRAALKHTNLPIGRTGARVLELAHGTGNLQRDLLGLGYKAFGYDLSPAMGRIARARLLRAGYKPKLVRGIAQALPFPAERFDAVVCTFPTDFIIDPATVREVYRVLRPGARLVFVPNATFTKPGLTTAGLEALYRVTGQRADSPDWRGVYESVGFTVTQALEPCKRSMAAVIIAHKPAQS